MFLRYGVFGVELGFEGGDLTAEALQLLGGDATGLLVGFSQQVELGLDVRFVVAHVGLVVYQHCLKGVHSLGQGLVLGFQIGLFGFVFLLQIFEVSSKSLIFGSEMTDLLGPKAFSRGTHLVCSL